VRCGAFDGPLEGKALCQGTAKHSENHIRPAKACRQDSAFWGNGTGQKQWLVAVFSISCFGLRHQREKARLQQTRTVVYFTIPPSHQSAIAKPFNARTPSPPKPFSAQM
jgi:hypothetical protein